MQCKRSFLIGLPLFLILLVWMPVSAQDDPQLKHYRQTLRPILSEHCFSCHNEPDKKGGLNLERYDFIVSIIRDGPVWVQVLDQIRSGAMPPSTKPPIPIEERSILMEGIEAILDSALSEPDPGQVVMRRLSNREYGYTVKDLFGVDFDARSFFPADASGGEGFDNQAKVLYLTPLLMERYMAAADTIIDKVYEDEEVWLRIAGDAFPENWFQQTRLWISSWRDQDAWIQGARAKARMHLMPVAMRAYRRPLKVEEKEQLMALFEDVYRQAFEAEVHKTPSGKRNKLSFDTAMRECMKYLLVSPHFLYRRELDLPVSSPYPITSFELASRLSYFLWSSAPDDALLAAAYRNDLHDPEHMRSQLERMLADPRSIRLAESFAGQWLGIDRLLDAHQVDPDRFPAYSPSIRKAMYEEGIQFFHHVLTGRQNLLDVIDSDYTFLNESLASYYGIEGVEGDLFRKVTHEDGRRGGVLGLGGVLTITSFPTRTSPVLRGKWVLEQILGTPPPPPPPDVPELEEQVDEHGEKARELDIRALLQQHRSPSACFGCHQRMDPLGIGLENFDAIGRWRDTYGETEVDASGVMPDGSQFTGPAELRRILLAKKELYARNLARKTLSFALGRSIRFQDKRVVDILADTLLEHNFASTPFLYELVMSYPFRYKKSDLITETTAP